MADSKLKPVISESKLKSPLCLANYTLHHQGVWGSGCIDPYTLDLGTNWRWVISFTPRPLYSRGNNPRYSLDKGLVGTQNLCGRGEEKKILPLPGLELRTLGRPDLNQSLHRMCYPGSFQKFTFAIKYHYQLHVIYYVNNCTAYYDEPQTLINQWVNWHLLHLSF
jgi:hypothetical protein